MFLNKHDFSLNREEWGEIGRSEGKYGVGENREGQGKIGKSGKK